MPALLFIHDHPFHTTADGKVYSGGSFPAYVWERYLLHFDKITVISRGIRGNIEAGLIDATHENVRFELIYDIDGGAGYFRKKKEIQEKFKKAAGNHDAVLMRLPSFIAFWCAGICRERKISYASEVVSCVWDATWNYGGIASKIIAPWAYFLMKKAVENSTATMYVTRYFLQSRYPNSNGIIEYASNVEIPPFNDDVLHNHQEFLSRKHTEYQLGMIANLGVKYKGFDVALKALHRVKKVGIPFRLHLIGGGNSCYVKSLLRKYDLEDYVNIAGRLKSGDEIFHFLDKLDLYIHPSRQEGLPRSVVEAMSRACPVLASAIAGIPELLEDKYLHTPGNAGQFTHQLINFLYAPDRLKEMSLQNFHKAKEYQEQILSQKRTRFWKKVFG